MGNKGFTLTELIVTIALLGVIMAISFPAITKLQTQNQKKVYETYETSLLHGAKLYVDKYNRDLWGASTNPYYNCVKITYGNLEYEDLIKPFNGMKKKEEVDKENTYVIVSKNKGNNSVKYDKVFLQIKQGDNVIYSTQSDNDNSNISECNKTNLPSSISSENS